MPAVANPPAIMRHADASQSAIVSARFRHLALPRLASWAQASPDEIRTSCYRAAPTWRCSAVVLDDVGVAAVAYFRFTASKERWHWAGPSGPRWHMAMPAIRRGYELHGYIVQVTIGKPMCSRANQWPC